MLSDLTGCDFPQAAVTVADIVFETMEMGPCKLTDQQVAVVVATQLAL